MRFSLTVLALVGATVAIPTRLARDVIVQDVEIDTVVDVVTDTVTVVGPSPAPSPAPEAPAPAPAAPTPDVKVQVVTVVEGAPSPAPEPAAPAPAPAAPAPAPAAPSPAPKNQSPGGSDATPPAAAPADPNDPSPMSGGQSMLSIINKYRTAYNLGKLAWDSQLQANAQKTSDDDHGSKEDHELNPGSFAQVLTPGNDDIPLMGLTPFEVAYVGGWLCEVPTPQLNGICPQLDDQAGLDVSGETGHADILNNNQYTKIGCSYTANGPNGGSGQWKGLWACDLA